MTSIEIVESPLAVLVFIIPTMFALIIFGLGRFSRLLREGLAFVGLLVTFLISVAIYQKVMAGYVLSAWKMTIYVDGLSALMEIIGSLMGLLIVLYSPRYLKRRGLPEEITPKRLGLYYGLLLLFLGTMNWTCATNNIVMLYVSLEATTLATTFLITFYWGKRASEAGYKYLLLVTIGVTFALFGCVLVYSASLPHLSGHEALLFTSIGKVAGKIPGSIVLLACAFFIAGFGTKAGLMPFHAWLPDAHAEAPAPISALLSGIVIKVGAYALVRTVTVFAPHYNAIVVFIAIIASTSMLIGICLALVQDDLKRMLAYSSISQIAYVIEGIGLGTYLGIYGGLFHLLNHTIIKALLFLTAGALLYMMGTRSIRELQKMPKNMPITLFCFFIGALAIAGMPPFNGFLSKLTLFLAIAQRGLLWAAVIAVLTSLLTLACFVRAAYRIFWSQPVKQLANNPGIKEVPFSMWLGMGVLALLCIVIGIYPNLVHPILESATQCILKILGG